MPDSCLGACLPPAEGVAYVLPEGRSLIPAWEGVACLLLRGGGACVLPEGVPDPCLRGECLLPD